MSTTIRISDEAHTALIEVLGLKQARERRKVYLNEIVDDLVKLIPESWRRLEG